MEGLLSTKPTLSTLSNFFLSYGLKTGRPSYKLVKEGGPEIGLKSNNRTEVQVQVQVQVITLSSPGMSSPR